METLAVILLSVLGSFLVLGSLFVSDRHLSKRVDLGQTGALLIIAAIILAAIKG